MGYRDLFSGILFCAYTLLQGEYDEIISQIMVTWVDIGICN
jgi:hypothetical protein